MLGTLHFAGLRKRPGYPLNRNFEPALALDTAPIRAAFLDLHAVTLIRSHA